MRSSPRHLQTGPKEAHWAKICLSRVILMQESPEPSLASCGASSADETALKDGGSSELPILAARLNLEPTQGTEYSNSVGRCNNEVIEPMELRRSATCLSLEPTPTSDGAESDGEIENLGRPVFVRKKSGELVKPSLVKIPRVRSEPTTKSVHFKDKDHLVHVRRFSRLEHPSAVSFNVGADDDWSGSEFDDEDTDLEADKVALCDLSKFSLETPNLTPHKYANASAENRPIVYLDSFTLSRAHNSFFGNVFVRNLGYAKDVTLRITADDWASYSEIKTVWSGDIRKRDRQAGYDRFVFTIGMANMPAALLSGHPMYVCIRYDVNGHEYWDNNGGSNYKACLVDQAGERQRRSRQRWFPDQRKRPGPTRLALDTDLEFPNASEAYNPSEAQSDYNSLLASISGLPLRSDATNNVAGGPQGHLKNRYSFHAAYNSPPHSKPSRIPSSEPLSPTASSGGTHRKAERVFPNSGQDKGWNVSSYEDLLSKYCFYGSRDTEKEQGQSLKKESVPLSL